MMEVIDVMKLDINNPIPLHIQLKNILIEEIKADKYKDKIPSERELMNRFSVSRTTVREAISALVREGFLEKRHGKGTFVSLKPVQEWLGQAIGFEETVKNMGMKPSSKLLSHGLKPCPENIQDALQSDQCYLIERLRFADDEPIAVKRHYFPVEIGVQLAKHDLDTAVLYDLVENHLGIKFWDAEQMITSQIATPEIAELLNIPPHSSVLVKEQLLYDLENNLVEYSESIFRTDKYAFHMKMSRRRD
jgi:GntR family transcriptional regulator